jgi:PhnB protein
LTVGLWWVPDVERWRCIAAAPDNAGMETFEVTLTPVLTVRSAASAVAFYREAFGAVEVHRSTAGDGQIVAELSVGGARFRVADESRAAANLSPATLAGTTVRLNLLVPDPDTVQAHAIEAGAAEVTPVADQPFGLRQGRIADPFGHHWLIGRPLDGPAGDWARPARPA